MKAAVSSFLRFKQTTRIIKSLFWGGMIFWQMLFANQPAPRDKVPLVTLPANSLVLMTHSLQQMPSGTLLMHVGMNFRDDWQAPLSQLKGDLTRWAVFQVAYFVAPRVAIRVTGAAHQVLSLNRSTSPSTNPSRERTASDVADFTVSTIATLFAAGKYRPAFGLNLETKLPNTNQDQGLGTNTTDASFAILASNRYGPVAVFTEVGVAILSSPIDTNDQNDVWVYGAGFNWKAARFAMITGEVNGFFSTRLTVPPGTEDRGRLRLGVVWMLGKFSLETIPEYGLNRREGGWGVTIGVSTQLNLLGNHLP